MAIGANKSDVTIVGEAKLYTGITNMNVIAINPTLDELHELGLTYIQNEPEYITDSQPKEGEEEGFKPWKKCRLDFYLQNTYIITKVTFFLENKIFMNKDKSKSQFINKFAQTAWAEDLESACNLESKKGGKWFKEDGAKEAKIGEGQLHEFIMAWMNVKPGDDCQLAKFDSLFKGDYKELRDLLKYKNEVRVMLTVKDNKYQGVLNSIFDRATSSTVTRFETFIKKQKEAGYPIKDAFSYTYKAHVAVIMDPETEVEDATNNAPSAEDVF